MKTIPESEVRFQQSKLNNVDSVMIEYDDETGEVSHAEIHSFDDLLWKWPEDARTKFRRHFFDTPKGFSLARKDYEVSFMEKDMIV